MTKPSAASKIVRKSAKAIPPASEADLERLRGAMQGQIDTGEIPERRKFLRLQRDASGRLPPRKSMIREAVEQQRRQLNLTVYRLWKMAQVHYPPLSQAAVHEFLKGQRQLELPSVEALLAAMQLRVVGKSGTNRGQAQQAKVQSAKKSAHEE
jgi:hypothetical protein